MPEEKKEGRNGPVYRKPERVGTLKQKEESRRTGVLSLSRHDVPKNGTEKTEMGTLLGIDG